MDKVLVSPNRKQIAIKNGKYEKGISIKKLIERDGNKCYLCGREVSYSNSTIDPLYPNIEHVMPISRGGTHSWDNVKVSCRHCNIRKNSMTLEEYLKTQEEPCVSTSDKQGLLTVKQLADKLNVSKQTINNNVPPNMDYQKIDGMNYINKELAVAIERKIELNRNKYSYSNNVYREERTEPTNNQQEIKLKDEYIKILKEQLKSKDKELDRYHEIFNGLHETIKNNNTQIEKLERAIEEQKPKRKIRGKRAINSWHSIIITI